MVGVVGEGDGCLVGLISPSFPHQQPSTTTISPPSHHHLITTSPLFHHQETILGELKQKQRIREKKVLSRDEVCHGTLEDILLGG